MITDAPNLNILWTELIIEELIRNGVDHFIISPGSRSTPLTVAAARNPKAKTTVHFDERGAAFFALGTAKALGKPCALICTSGTAVANYFPAIVEASMSYVPLIVLTADRPPELQNTGANQTINQTNIYGEYVRHFVSMPCPDEQVPMEYVLTTIDSAMRACLDLRPGPIHINCAFREPLTPITRDTANIPMPPNMLAWKTKNLPYTSGPAERTEICSDLNLAQTIAEFYKVLVVVGHAQWAQSRHLNTLDLDVLGLDWPVFADATSGARVEKFLPELSAPIANFDLLLRSARFRELCQPEVVIHLGGAVVSRQLQEYLASIHPSMYVHVTKYSDRLDPAHRVTHRIQDFRLGLLGTFSLNKKEMYPNPSGWTNAISQASASAHAIIDEVLVDHRDISDPWLLREITRQLEGERDCDLYVGNSMPIRDLNAFGVPMHMSVDVIANRGASGIDGNIATAAGYAKTSGRHLIAILGDLATLHDLNSLALLKQKGVRVTLIVINNNGGGIFHFLPISEHTDVFEKFFGTPHGLNFEHAASMFGLTYTRPATKAEFIEAFKNAKDSATSSIIEVITDREENLWLHRQISDAVVKALEGM